MSRTSLEPDSDALNKLQSLDPDAPVGVLNLFRFNTQARYAPDDPEFGTDTAAATGQEAYARYGAVAGPIIGDLGGRVVFSTAVDQLVIGASDQQWDLAAIMYFPTRRAFVAMTQNPEFQAASRHRKAALENHLMLHLAGDPFVAQTPKQAPQQATEPP